MFAFAAAMWYASEMFEKIKNPKARAANIALAMAYAFVLLSAFALALAWQFSGGRADGIFSF